MFAKSKNGSEDSADAQACYDENSARHDSPRQKLTACLCAKPIMPFECQKPSRDVRTPLRRLDDSRNYLGTLEPRHDVQMTLETAKEC